MLQALHLRLRASTGSLLLFGFLETVYFVASGIAASLVLHLGHLSCNQSLHAWTLVHSILAFVFCAAFAAAAFDVSKALLRWFPYGWLAFHLASYAWSIVGVVWTFSADETCRSHAEHLYKFALASSILFLSCGGALMLYGGYLVLAAYWPDWFSRTAEPTPKWAEGSTPDKPPLPVLTTALQQVRWQQQRERALSPANTAPSAQRVSQQQQSDSGSVVVAVSTVELQSVAQQSSEASAQAGEEGGVVMFHGGDAEPEDQAEQKENGKEEEGRKEKESAAAGGATQSDGTATPAAADSGMEKDRKGEAEAASEAKEKEETAGAPAAVGVEEAAGKEQEREGSDQKQKADGAAPEVRVLTEAEMVALVQQHQQEEEAEDFEI